MLHSLGRTKLERVASTSVIVIVTSLSFYYLGAIQTFGWVYSIAFAISAVPEAVNCVRRGRTDVADGTILSWLTGELAGVVYGVGLYEWPLIVNCTANAIGVGVILWYRLFPRS